MKTHKQSDSQLLEAAERVDGRGKLDQTVEVQIPDRKGERGYDREAAQRGKGGRKCQVKIKTCFYKTSIK